MKSDDCVEIHSWCDVKRAPVKSGLFPSTCRFAYTVAAVLLSTLVRRLRLHQVKGQVVEARYELVSTPKDDTWITVSKRD